MSNRAALATLLDQVCAETPTAEPMTVDVTAVRFADAATVRLLARQSGRRPGGVRVIGASPLFARLLADAGERVA